MIRNEKVREMFEKWMEDVDGDNWQTTLHALISRIEEVLSADLLAGASRPVTRLTDEVLSDAARRVGAGFTNPSDGQHAFMLALRELRAVRDACEVREVKLPGEEELHGIVVHLMDISEGNANGDDVARAVIAAVRQLNEVK